MSERKLRSLGYEQKPPERHPGGAILTLIGVTLVNGVITCTLFLLAILGLNGGLSDTSDRENRWQGIGFLAMAVLGVVWSIACFIALKPRKR
jgi:hypothetical protein